MNDANRKNAIYKMNSIKRIPYDSIENVQLNSDAINSIVVNNAFAQLADNDQVIANTIGRLTEYESGPKEFAEDKIEFFPIGYKMWVNNAASDLSILHKVETRLEDSLTSTTISSDILHVFEYGSGVFAITNDPKQNLYFGNSYDNTRFDKIAIPDNVKINNYTIHSGGILFATTNGIYSLSAYRVERYDSASDDGSYYDDAYAIVPLEFGSVSKRLPESDRNCHAVAVNESTNTIYVGTLSSIYSGFFVPSQGSLNHLILQTNAIVSSDIVDGAVVEVPVQVKVNNFATLRHNSFTYENDTLALTEDGVFQTGDYSSVLQSGHIFDDKNCVCSYQAFGKFYIGTTTGIYDITNGNTPAEFSPISPHTQTDQVLGFLPQNDKLFVIRPTCVDAFTYDGSTFQAETHSPAKSEKTIVKSFVYNMMYHTTVRPYICMAYNDGSVELRDFPNIGQTYSLVPEDSTTSMMNPGSRVLYYVESGELKAKIIHGLTTKYSNDIEPELKKFQNSVFQTSVTGNCIKILKHLAIFPNKIVDLVGQTVVSDTFNNEQILDICELTSPIRYGGIPYQYILLVSALSKTRFAFATSSLSSVVMLDAELSGSYLNIANTREFIIVSTTGKIDYFDKGDLYQTSPNTMHLSDLPPAGITSIASTYDYLWALVSGTVYEYTGRSSDKSQIATFDSIDIDLTSIVSIKCDQMTKLVFVLTETAVYAFKYIDASSRFIHTSKTFQSGVVAKSLSYSRLADKFDPYGDSSVIQVSTNKGIHRFCLDTTSTSITIRLPDEEALQVIYPDKAFIGYVDSLQGNQFFIQENGIYSVGEQSEELIQLSDKSGMTAIAQLSLNEQSNIIIALDSTSFYVYDEENESPTLSKVEGILAPTPTATLFSNLFGSYYQPSSTETLLFLREDENSTDGFTYEQVKIAGSTPLTATTFICDFSDELDFNDYYGYAISGTKLYGLRDTTATEIFDVATYANTSATAPKIATELIENITSSTITHIDFGRYTDFDKRQDDVPYVLITVNYNGKIYGLVYDVSDGTANRLRSCYQYSSKQETGIDSAHAIKVPSVSELYFATTPDSVYYRTNSNLIQTLLTEVIKNDPTLVDDDDSEFEQSDEENVVAHLSHTHELSSISNISRASDGTLYCTTTNGVYIIDNTPATFPPDDDENVYNLVDNYSPQIADIDILYTGTSAITYAADYLIISAGRLYQVGYSAAELHLVESGLYSKVEQVDDSRMFILKTVDGKSSIYLYTGDIYDVDSDELTEDIELDSTVLKSCRNSIIPVSDFRVTPTNRIIIEYQDALGIHVEQWRSNYATEDDAESESNTILKPSASIAAVLTPDEFTYTNQGSRVNLLNLLFDLPIADGDSTLYWLYISVGKNMIGYFDTTVDHLEKTGLAYTGVYSLKTLEMRSDGGVVGIIKSTDDGFQIIDIYDSDDGTILYSSESTSTPVDFCRVSNAYAYKEGSTWKIAFDDGVRSVPMTIEGSDTQANIAGMSDATYDIVVATDQGVYRIEFSDASEIIINDHESDALDSFNSNSNDIVDLIGHNYATDDVIVMTETSGVKRLWHYSFDDDTVTEIQFSAECDGQPEILDCVTDVWFNTGVNDSQYKLVINDDGDTRKAYYGRSFSNLVEYPDQSIFEKHSNSSDDIVINGVSTFQRIMYIFTTDGIYYSEGYKDITKFTKVKTLTSPSGKYECYQAIRIDNSRYLMTTNQGLRVVEVNCDSTNRMTLTQSIPAGTTSTSHALTQYVPTTTGTAQYLYSIIRSDSPSEKSLRYSRNGKRWKTFVDLSTLSNVDRINSLAVKNNKIFYIGTNAGLYVTNCEYTVVNDIKKLTDSTINSIFDSPKIKSQFQTVYNDQQQKHIDNDHDDQMAQLNSMVGYDFDGIDHSIWTSDGGSGRTTIVKDKAIVDSCVFGNSSDMNIVATAKSVVSDDQIQLDYSYILKRGSDGINELLIYLPTTYTYYINHNPGSPNCSTLQATARVRTNLIGICDKAISGNLAETFTEFSLTIKPELCQISQVIDVQVQGNSLPLRIYKDETAYGDGAGSEYIASTMYHSFIEPTICKGWTWSGTSLKFTFACFGSDAQAIRILFM